MEVLGALCPARLRARDLAAGAAMTAALIHLEVVPEHLREWKLEGAFFAALAAAQALLALLLLRGRATIRTLLTGICGTVGVIALYVLSRTAGLAVGPRRVHAAPVLGGVGNGLPVLPGSPIARHIESVGVLDLSCLVAELALIATLVGLLPTRARGVTTNVMLLGGVTLLAVRALI